MTYSYGGGNGGSFNLRIIIGVLIALFGVISYFLHTSVNPTTGEHQHVSMSPEQEIALGLQSAPEMAAQMGGDVPATDPEAREVAAIGELIHSKSTAAKSPYQYQYHLLNDRQTINAFALPGGQVFVTRGLYEKLSDEAELAGVLGHETGHVVERHSAQQLEKRKLGELLVVATGVATSDRRNGGSSTLAAQVANHMIQLHFSREDESQADQRGLQFMTEAGFDPRAMIDVMKILQQVAGRGGQPEFLATHPDPGNRIEAIEQWLKDNPSRAVELSRGKALPKD